MAWIASRRLLLVLSDVPNWQSEDDGPRRTVTHRYVHPRVVKDYFCVVRNWASRQDKVEVHGVIYPVSSGNQVWYSDGETAICCLSGAGERCVFTLPAVWLHDWIARQRAFAPKQRRSASA